MKITPALHWGYKTKTSFGESEEGKQEMSRTWYLLSIFWRILYIYYRTQSFIVSFFFYLYLVNTKAKGPHLRAFELINFYLIWLPFCLVASNNFLWNSSCFGFDITNNATAAIRGLITNAISNHVNQPLPLELASTPTSAANTIHKITIIIVHFPVVIKVNLKLYAYYNDCQEQLKIKMWRKATMCIFPIER